MAGLGRVPSGSIVSRTPCRMSPSSWKLASLARSGSIHASMNCLDRSSDAASLLSLSLALLLSLDPRRPAPVPPTAGLEYRERVALVVGGALMAAAPGVPGVGSPPLLLRRAASWPGRAPAHDLGGLRLRTPPYMRY